MSLLNRTSLLVALSLCAFALACPEAPDDTPGEGEGEGETGEGEGEGEPAEGEGETGEGEGEGEGEPDPFIDTVVTNPVLGGDHPDPHVLRTTDAQGVLYVMTHTVHNGGDIPIWTSRDLVTWEQRPQGAFGRPRAPGTPLRFGLNHGFVYCSVWAPAISEVRPGLYQLNFTAQRYDDSRESCGGYAEDSGVYLASSTSPFGPFAPDERSWEPLPAGGHITNCQAPTKNNIPRSLPLASQDCQGGFCHQVIRLDADVFVDSGPGGTGKTWMTYAWYTNTPPRVAFEQSNYGEHVHVVELDDADPFTVPCRENATQVHIANPHDSRTMNRLRDGCDRCDENLSFTVGRSGENFVRDGHLWGVVEGASLHRFGDLVYAFVSGGVWDSPTYQVFFVAASTVEGLSVDNDSRIVGRVIIPGGGMSFGHGSVVVGPDGEQLFYLHHRLRHAACRDQGDCARDLWLTPLTFEDRGDGRGAVWITPRFPAEQSSVVVRLPR